MGDSKRMESPKEDKRRQMRREVCVSFRQNVQQGQQGGGRYVGMQMVGEEGDKDDDE